MQESRCFRRMGRPGPILGVLLLASFLPTPAAAAGKTFKFRVPMQTSGDGLTGHVEFMARGACMGRWIQIGVSQAMIEGVRVGGRVYTEVPGYDLPMDAAGKGGQYRLSGAFIAQEGSRRVRWPIRSYRVADKLEGFLETINMSTPRSEAMSCPEWEAYVDTHLAPVSRHELVVDEILATWARDMIGAVKKTLSNLEKLESLRRQLATASGEDVITGVLRRLEALERKELTAEARQYARELITEARGRLEKLGAARPKEEEEETRAAAAPSTGGRRGAAAGGHAAAAVGSAASALAGGGSSGQGAGGSGEAATQKQRQTTQGQRAAQGYIDLARRFEAAGNYNHAIGHYRQAQMAFHQSWVEQKIRSLQQKQQEQRSSLHQQQSEAARALGRGIAAVAGGRGSSGSSGP